MEAYISQVDISKRAIKKEVEPIKKSRQRYNQTTYENVYRKNIMKVKWDQSGREDEAKVK